MRRINQLGAQAGGEGDAIQVDGRGVDGKVDITLKVEEQNRNPLSFGAGISQFEGFSASSFRRRTSSAAERPSSPAEGRSEQLPAFLQ